jgi:hypothetical protein
MRNTPLSRLGAARTRTHVMATADSHMPSSVTATVGGNAGFGGTMAGSTETGVRLTTGARTAGAGVGSAGVGVACMVAALPVTETTALGAESAAACAVSDDGTASAVASESGAGCVAVFVRSTRCDIM